MEDQFKQLLASNDVDNITIAVLQLPNFDINLEPLLDHTYNLITGVFDNMTSNSQRIGNESTYILLEKNLDACSVRVVVNGRNTLNKVFLLDRFSKFTIQEVFKNLKPC